MVVLSAESKALPIHVVEISEDGNTMTCGHSIPSRWWILDLRIDKDQRTDNGGGDNGGGDNGGGDNGGGGDASALEGSWSLSPEAGALGVGPNQGDISWWSNSEEDVAIRACLMDDEFVFDADGSFANVMGGSTWLEGWQGADEGCGTPVYPYDGSDSSLTYSYDATAQTITINGQGGHIGLAKVYNGGEWDAEKNPYDGSAVAESVTYTIVEMEATRMTVEIQFQPGGGYWTYVLTKN